MIMNNTSNVKKVKYNIMKKQYIIICIANYLANKIELYIKIHFY